MADEQQPSPEEKLLKVIQAGKKPDESKAAVPAPAPAAKAAAPVAPPPAKPAPAVAATPPPVVKAAPAAKPAVPAAAKPPAPSKPAAEPKPAGHAPAAAAAPAPKAPVAAEPAAGEKPKLKLAPAEAAPAGVVSDSQAKPAVKSGMIGMSSSAAPVHRKAVVPLGISFVNKCLATAAAVAVIASGFEILAAMKEADLDGRTGGVPAVGEPPPGTDAGGLASAGATGSEPDIQPVIEAFKARNIWDYGQASGAKPPPGPVGTTEPPPVSQTTADLVKRFKLMGVSAVSDTEMEAIVSDTQDNKLVFVRTAGKIMLGDRQFELVSIGADHVIVTDGEERVTLK